MSFPKTGVSRQQSQDMTNLLETSMDSPMRQPSEAKREDEKLELHQKEKHRYRISQVKDTADWTSLSGWDGGPSAKSPKVPPNNTPASSPLGKSNSRLQTEAQIIPSLKTSDQSEKFIGYDASKATRDPSISQPRNLVRKPRQQNTTTVRSSATSSEQRKPFTFPDPSTMTLADFVRTSLGFNPTETARFQNRAKANSIKNPRRSIASEASEKLELTDSEKYQIIREPSISGLSSLKASTMNSKESYFGANNISGGWTQRRPASIKKELLQGSYLEQKRLLKDTKKILANLSRVRVMNMLGTSSKNDSNVDTQKSRDKPRFSLNMRQASATSSQRSPMALQSEECSQIVQPALLSPNLQSRPNFSPKSPEDPKKAVFYKLIEETNSPPSPNKKISLLSMGHDKVQQVLRTQLRSLNSMRLQYGTHIGGLIKSQTLNADERSFEKEKELSASKKAALQQWRENFGKSNVPGYLGRSDSARGFAQEPSSPTRDEFKQRSDIEGLMWQLDTIGKKFASSKMRDRSLQNQLAQSNSRGPARPNSPQTRQFVEQVTLEKKVLTPFQQGTGVNRGRHVRSVSLGFVVPPKAQPVVGIKNSSGRLLGRYQLKKTFVPL